MTVRAVFVLLIAFASGCATCGDRRKDDDEAKDPRDEYCEREDCGRFGD